MGAKFSSGRTPRTIIGFARGVFYLSMFTIRRLLDNDGQVHPLVDRAVDVVGPRCGKWSNLNAVPIDLYVVDSGCA